MNNSKSLMLLCALAMATIAFPAGAKTNTYPALTGRVVDAADLMTDNQEAALTEKLARIEQTTGHQVVVATIPTIGDGGIEDYANGLARTWGIGSDKDDDGVVLVVAQKERKIRIEVGYGLEPTLTDATSSAIIRHDIAPKLKRGDVAGGITDGVDAIALVITPETAADKAEREAQEARNHAAYLAFAAKSQARMLWFLNIVMWTVIFGVCGYAFYFAVTAPRRKRQRLEAKARYAQILRQQQEAAAALAAEHRALAQAEAVREAERRRLYAAMLANETPVQRAARQQREAAVAAQAARQAEEARAAQRKREAASRASELADEARRASSRQTSRRADDNDGGGGGSVFGGGGGDFGGGGASGDF